MKTNLFSKAYSLKVPMWVPNMWKAKLMQLECFVLIQGVLSMALSPMRAGSDDSTNM